MTMNIFCIIIALPLTPSHCRGVVLEDRVPQDPSSQLTRIRLPNSEFLFQHGKLTTMTNKEDHVEDRYTTMTNNDDLVNDQNTTMTDNEDEFEDQKNTTMTNNDGGSDVKSRRSRSLARSQHQTEPSSPPGPPPSLVALLALDIIAGLFAFHALAALFFILPQ